MTFQVNRASAACGPLVKWLKSQVLYSSILGKVDPLRKELGHLERETGSKRTKCEELDRAITTLEEQASYI